MIISINIEDLQHCPENFRVLVKKSYLKFSLFRYFFENVQKNEKIRRDSEKTTNSFDMKKIGYVIIC